MQREKPLLVWMQLNMDGNVLARRIVYRCYWSQSGRRLLTVVREKKVKKLSYFKCNMCRSGAVFPAGFRSNFRIMVGSASGPGSTFKAFLGSARVRVPLSNKIRIRVGSVQHIYELLDPWRPLMHMPSSLYCMASSLNCGNGLPYKTCWVNDSMTHWYTYIWNEVLYMPCT